MRNTGRSCFADSIKKVHSLTHHVMGCVSVLMKNESGMSILSSQTVNK